MAAGQLSLTRRALLAGACAAPVLECHPELGSESRPDAAGRVTNWTLKQVQGDGRCEERWAGALARFRAADAAIEAARHSEDEALYDRLGERHDAAIKRLLRTAAPDVAALAVKLELMFAEQAWEMIGGELCLAAVLRDARRLAGG